MKKNPYSVVKHRHITEKSTVLQELKSNESNPSVRACESSKYVFIVDKRANKKEIKEAVEEIYSEKHVKVIAVNTVIAKSKPRRVRGRPGRTSTFKKAIVTLDKGDSLDDV